VDERVVPPDHADSNYRMAVEHLIGPAGIPLEHLNRIAGERYPEEAAAHYVSEIRVDFKLKENELPVFDLIHRGMGADSHTASLFPGDPLIEDEYEIAANTYVEKFDSHRVTLLPGVLKKARHTVILAPGADKANALWDVLEGKDNVKAHPCQIAAKPPYPTEWFVDEAAARLLLAPFDGARVGNEAVAVGHLDGRQRFLVELSRFIDDTVPVEQHRRQGVDFVRRQRARCVIRHGAADVIKHGGGMGPVGAHRLDGLGGSERTHATH
jgi:6-phosphogluconolactonase